MNNGAIAVKYEDFYNEHEKQRYLDFVPSLSDSIHFDDDKWVCEKRIKSTHETPYDVTIYFTQIPDKYKIMIKYYALIMLIHGNRIRIVNTNIGSIAVFLRFTDNVSLNNITVLTASRFKEYIDRKGLTVNTRAGIWADVGKFLTRMNGYDGIQLKNPFTKGVYRYEKLYDYKYIPGEITDRLDVIFRDDNI